MVTFREWAIDRIIEEDEPWLRKHLSEELADLLGASKRNIFEQVTRLRIERGLATVNDFRNGEESRAGGYFTSPPESDLRTDVRSPKKRAQAASAGGTRSRRA
jgi:hypothetical protein